MADDTDHATVVVKSEKPDDTDLPFENDGNFLQNYLNSQKNAKKPDLGNIHVSIKQEPQKKVGPPIKKSRFTSMLNQIKRTKAGVTAVPTAKVSCFYNEDSSSSEEDEGHEESPKAKPPKTKAIISNNNVPSVSLRQSTGTLVVTAPSIVKPAIANATPVAETSTAGAQGTAQSNVRKRESRWGEKIDLAEFAPPGIANLPGMPTIPTVSPNLGVPISYRPVGLVGCSELSDAQRKQLEEQREMQAMYNLVMASRNARVAVSQQVAAASQTSKKKNKHQYDSDEEIDDDVGTWEHRNRRFEMDKTQELAEKLTNQSEGKHFIGDFLPPDELKHFMETFKALKEGRTPDLSDYKDFKIKCDNMGFKMLEKMGWNEGEGLGNAGQGIIAPINQGKQSIDGRGVGVDRPDGLTGDDDEFSAYRKRMMLAYRFRPNPLNNPRRSYY